MTPSSPLARQRRRAAAVTAVGLVLGVYWTLFSAGLPVWWGPTARASDIVAGKDLFEHEWAANDPRAHGDGLGPVFNATSCVACHFQGGVGGGGEISHNATHYEALPTPSRPELVAGTLHKFSVRKEDKESPAALRRRFPVEKGPPLPYDPHCGGPAPRTPARGPDFDPVRTLSVQSTAIFGAGWADRISEKAIIKNHRRRAFEAATAELRLDFAGVPAGRLRTLPDGRVGRFGWKAQAASLKDFVATACADEIGLGTPHKPQVAPLARTAAVSTTVEPDLDRTQFNQLLAFVDTLPKPVEAAPESPAEREFAARGKALFTEVGCAVCHVPDLGGVAGVYSDFLLYALDDPIPAGGGSGGYGPPPLPDFPRPPGEPRPEEWKTPLLWGVADSAPYMHDGTALTLEDAIARHRGDATPVRTRYDALSAGDQAAVVAFLETLKAPPTAAVVVAGRK